jgi:hypothetical protein
MYAGWLDDCCDEARDLVQRYGAEPVWMFSLLVTGYPITFDLDSLANGKLTRFLKVWSELKWRS